MVQQLGDFPRIRRWDNDDRDVLGGPRGGADRCGHGPSSSADAGVPAADLTIAARERHGLVWVVSAFVICPCHLPLTLALLSWLLAGVGIETFRRGSIGAGVMITVVWAVATWRGVSLLRPAHRANAPCERC
jgi:hypothetical protein